MNTNRRRAKRWLNVNGPNGHPIRLTVSADGATIILREKHSKRPYIFSSSVLVELMRQRREAEFEVERLAMIADRERNHPVFSFVSELAPASPQPAANPPAESQSCDA